MYLEQQLGWLRTTPMTSYFIQLKKKVWLICKNIFKYVLHKTSFASTNEFYKFTEALKPKKTEGLQKKMVTKIF